MLVDTHCHVQFDAYKADATEVIDRAISRNIILNVVGTQKNTSKKAVALAEAYTNVYATIGTHPVHLHATHIDEEETSFLSREESFDSAFYSQLVQSKKVIAIGETGIDLFHLPKEVSKEEVLEKQTHVFLDHIAFAHKHDLPVVIHCRDGHKELLNILSKIDYPISGTVHCYTGNWEFAQEYMKYNLCLGFTGIISFPAKKTNPTPQEELIHVVKNIPVDRMLIETDAPYLAPQAFRGKRNEPFMVEEVAKTIAEIKGMSFEEVADITTKNAQRIFTRLMI
ncbi:MAG: hydrolase TatD [Candidatus Magasanikbacteria bacterium]|nr:hydrolase TatD [Candidatus Magasanikbacteria bacterium]